MRRRARTIQRSRLAHSERLEPRVVLAAGPVITEFLAINDSSLADGDGNFSDWIEIHNPTSSSVSLDGWHLTDDRGDLTQWPLPNIALDGGEYLVVFASGQDTVDYVDGAGNYHTNFRLAGGGEDLLLVEPDETTYDPIFLDYPAQSADVSFGVSLDGITETLVASDGALSYRIPSAIDDATEWTEVGFDDATFVDQQTVAGAGVLITEIETAEAVRSIEIQNVAAEEIDTQGWTVVVNDASAGESAAVSRVWELPSAIEPAEIVYRRDQVGDEYWGAAIPWQTDGPGWAVVLDDTGEVKDAAIWGYTSDQISNIRFDSGPHRDISLAAHWQGDGAAVGAGGVVSEPIEVGPGADLGAVDVDSPGIRLNIEPEFVETLSAGTYDVQDIAFAANSNGSGELRAFLAVLTGGTQYETIWASPATTPSAGDTLHQVEYPTGTQQFTLDSEADVYAGAWHDGSAKVRFSNQATVTNHDNSPITPTSSGQTIRDFSHGSLNNRTYAYHVTVGAQGSATSLMRTGVTDDDSSENFQRAATPTIGSQNPDSASLFGGIVPTIAGVGIGDGDPVLGDLIQTDVTNTMLGINASLRTRFEFSSADLTNFDNLTFQVRYDDGFLAYLDGVPIAARNAPENLTYDSSATAERTRDDALRFEEIDVTDALQQLGEGEHVLAVQVLNSTINDRDLLFQPELLASREGIGQFFEDATPGQAAVAGGFNTVADTKFSTDRGFYEAPIDVEISTVTNGATIVYTLDGTPPEVDANGNIRNGQAYTSPLNIARTTTLRALAYKRGLRSSNVDTQTYLFTDDIVQQTRQSTVAAGFPSSWGGRGADYGLDPDVVGPNDLFDGVYAASIAEDLKSLPTLSLVLDIDDMFGSRGIYSNIGSRGEAWERPVSAEIIYPDGTESFQIDAGIRVHGGASRSLSRKNNLRLLFKEEYGATKLDYPLFGDGVDRFDTVVLRAHFNDGWGWSGAGSDPLFSRDMWHRQTQAAMGHTSPRGENVHLYINGVYWGLYNPSERPDASFAAQHLGGDKEDWDAMNHNGLVDGSTSAWNRMRSLAAAVNSASGATAKWSAYQRLQGNDSNGDNDPSREDYLDIENYIDYLLLSFYSGNDDWPNRNWYAGRRRGDESEGFQFFAWDSEISMDLSNRTSLNENVIRDANNGAVGAATAYGSLRNYEEFQVAFGDRVQRHMFNGGVFYVDPENPDWDPDHPERNVPAARFAAVAEAVSRAIVPESARWGDQHRSRPYTRNDEWQSELDHMLNDFFPRRGDIVLSQLRANNLYPSIDAPVFEVDGVAQHGGAVAQGAPLGLSNPNGNAGTIWYTTDGSDPRLPGGDINSASAIRFTGTVPVNEVSTFKARILDGNEWSALSEAEFAFDQTGLRIAELHFNPADATAAELTVDPNFDNDDFEFVELVNTSDSTIDLRGVQFVDGIQFSSFDPSSIEPNERVVLVSNLDAFSVRYESLLDSITIVGQYDTALSNGGEAIKAISTLGDTLFDFEYNDNWFDLTDGVGYSLTVLDPSDAAADLSESSSWRPSRLEGGSPGAADVLAAPDSVVIHELLATQSGTGWLELHNQSQAAVDISHWYLSDSADTLRKYQFALGTTIAPGGYLQVDEASQFGIGSADAGAIVPFGLSGRGGQIYLTGGDEQSRLLGYRERQPYTAAEAEVSLGRYTKSTGATDFVRMVPTPGAGNAEPILGPVVMNEVMYHPAEQDREYIELRNITNDRIALGNDQGRPWRVRGGIDFVFPSDAEVPSNGFAILVQQSAADPQEDIAAFRAQYGVAPDVPIWTYSPSLHGSLDNDGEKVFLERPVVDLPADAYAIVDAVKYNDQFPWPTEADGSGPSLSRIGETVYGNDVANWGVSTRNGTPGSDNAFQDTTPPTQPSNVVGRIENATTVSLAWAEASDPQSGIDHYRIYRNGQVVGTSVVTRFTTTLEFGADGANQFWVSAVNGDGAEGERSLSSVDFSPQSIDFQQGLRGYAGAQDAEIRESDPNANNGLTDGVLEVDGEDAGGELAVLMRWGGLTVPADAAVASAFITVNVTNPGDQYAVYELRKDWDEAAVTWNDAASGERWQTAGARGAADRGPQVGTLDGQTGEAVINLNPAGIEMVRAWLTNPAERNFGITIANADDATDGVDLLSREDSSIRARPKLSILFAPSPSPSMLGDFNLDDAVDAADIDMLATAIRVDASDPVFDLDRNSTLDNRDFDYHIQEVMQVSFGDSNLDGTFNSADLVAVFGAGQYEDNLANNSGWAEGDWNGDGEFDTRDLVKAFQGGGYVSASQPRAVAAVAPSPLVADRFVDLKRMEMFAARDDVFARAEAMTDAGDDSTHLFQTASLTEGEHARRIVDDAAADWMNQRSDLRRLITSSFSHENDRQSDVKADSRDDLFASDLDDYLRLR